MYFIRTPARNPEDLCLPRFSRLGKSIARFNWKQITPENKFWEEIKKCNIYKESKRFGIAYTFFFEKEVVMKALKEHVGNEVADNQGRKYNRFFKHLVK